MKALSVLLFAMPLFAFAETTTVTVGGMHCSHCRHEVTEKVCGDAEVKSSTESCEVNWTNKKKQIGEIKMVLKKDAKIDMSKVEAQVKAAGEELRVIKNETK